MRDKTMDPFSDGVRQYETPVCEVFEVTVEETILSNPPGKAGNYNNGDDFIYEDAF